MIYGSFFTSSQIQLIRYFIHKQFFIVKLKSPLVHPGTQNITEYFNFQIIKYTSDLVLNVEPNCSVINVYKHEHSQSTITSSIFVNVISQKSLRRLHNFYKNKI